MSHTHIHLLRGTRTLLGLLVLMVAGLLVGACDDYDSWTTSPDAILHFSHDTLDFSTVITGQGSTTQTLVVGNPGDKGLRITHVALQGGDASLFRINVDGQWLPTGEGADYEVRRRDSIVVRVEVTLPETTGTDTIPYADRLLFTLESGVTQQVVLEAAGVDVNYLDAVVVEDELTLPAGRPYVVRDSLVVKPGAKLRLEPGVTLMFHDGVELQVHGTLDAQGTMQRPITFRGDRVDNLFDYLPYDNTPNRWGGIHFHSTSVSNVLRHCDIHGGNYGIVCDSTEVEEDAAPSLFLENCIIHNVGGTALELTHCVTSVIGCQISNALGHCVDILGGAHNFVHCTLAQFYPWDASRGDALFIANVDANGMVWPLLRAQFVNCIITGYADDVLMGSMADMEGIPAGYLFQNTLLRTTPVDDEYHYKQVTYDTEELEPQREHHFRLFDTHAFLYDFTPDSLSAARGMADMEYARYVSPMDMRGVSRLADGHPDAGCYEGVYRETTAE